MGWYSLTIMTAAPDNPMFDLPETPITTRWPTIGATAAGRFVGRLAGNRFGVGFFTLGKILALATIPVSLAVFCWQLLPYVCRRYRLSNRRLTVHKGLSAEVEQSLPLDAFETIDIEVLPGQEWLHAGDVVFRHSGAEVLRLRGVSRPDVFCQLCLKSKNALQAVEQVLRQQAAET